MKDIIECINEAIGDHRINMKGSIKHDSCPGHVMQGGNTKKVFKKGDIVYINPTQDGDEITGTPLKNKEMRPAKVVGIRVLKSTANYPGSQYLIDYSYEDDDRNVYTMNAKDVWNEIHVK